MQCIKLVLFTWKFGIVEHIEEAAQLFSFGLCILPEYIHHASLSAVGVANELELHVAFFGKAIFCIDSLIFGHPHTM